MTDNGKKMRINSLSVATASHTKTITPKPFRRSFYTPQDWNTPGAPITMRITTDVPFTSSSELALLPTAAAEPPTTTSRRHGGHQNKFADASSAVDAKYTAYYTGLCEQSTNVTSYSMAEWNATLHSDSFEIVFAPSAGLFVLCCRAAPEAAWRALPDLLVVNGPSALMVPTNLTQDTGFAVVILGVNLHVVAPRGLDIPSIVASRVDGDRYALVPTTTQCANAGTLTYGTEVYQYTYTALYTTQTSALFGSVAFNVTPSSSGYHAVCYYYQGVGWMEVGPVMYIRPDKHGVVKSKAEDNVSWAPLLLGLFLGLAGVAFLIVAFWFACIRAKRRRREKGSREKEEQKTDAKGGSKEEHEHNQNAERTRGPLPSFLNDNNLSPQLGVLHHGDLRHARGHDGVPLGVSGVTYPAAVYDGDQASVLHVKSYDELDAEYAHHHQHANKVSGNNGQHDGHHNHHRQHAHTPPLLRHAWVGHPPPRPREGNPLDVRSGESAANVAPQKAAFGVRDNQNHAQRNHDDVHRDMPTLKSDDAPPIKGLSNDDILLDHNDDGDDNNIPVSISEQLGTTLERNVELRAALKKLEADEHNDGAQSEVAPSGVQSQSLYNTRLEFALSPRDVLMQHVGVSFGVSVRGPPEHPNGHLDDDAITETIAPEVEIDWDSQSQPHSLSSDSSLTSADSERRMFRTARREQRRLERAIKRAELVRELRERVRSKPALH